MSKSIAKETVEMCCCKLKNLPVVSIVSVAFVVLWGFSFPALAATIEIFEGDDFEFAVENQLNPGDTLIVHEGTYVTSGRISIDVPGTESMPVVIKGADGESKPHITRMAGDTPQNTINVEGASYLTIKGLEISSNGGDGINMSGNPAYITLEDLEIHDVDVGLNFRSSMHHITVRNNHIYDLGQDGGTGEGMYVGCNYATCAVSDSIIENNWIHNTLNASQGDGIEIKRGSHSNIIRNNTIHDTNYPCILLYGTEGNPQNIVENNKMWNCGDSVIQAAADVIIRNNIMFGDASQGFNSQYHQEVTPNNIQFVHNTLIGGDPCLRLSSWGSKSNMVFANNAVYCVSENYILSDLTGVTIAGNVMSPGPGGFPNSGYSEGRSTDMDFEDASNRNVYPTSDSALIDAADAAFMTATDFNGTTRTGTPDAGAYTWSSGGGVNIPSISISADPQQVDMGGFATINWSTSNATSCEAFGDWSGSRDTIGSEPVGPLASERTYQLSCDGPGGSNSSSTIISINSGGGGGDSGGGGQKGDDNDDDDSGGPGAFEMINLLFYLIIFAFRRRTFYLPRKS